MRRFAAVGVLNTLVDYVLFVGLTKAFHVPLDLVWVAKIVSGSVTMSLSFYLNRMWVFRTQGRSLHQAPLFLATTLVAVYGIQTPLTHLFAAVYPHLGEQVFGVVEATGLPSVFPSVATEALVIKTVAFALATSASMIFTFLAYRFWVFRPAPSPT